MLVLRRSVPFLVNYDRVFRCRSGAHVDLALKAGGGVGGAGGCGPRALAMLWVLVLVQYVGEVKNLGIGRSALTGAHHSPPKTSVGF
jgi:hypothetical protein